jgi:hypothetical protein
VEATLVDAEGPGLWRFRLDLGGGAILEPGSLQVTAGTVELQGPDDLVFRMEGFPGERVVFTFRHW